MVEFVTSDRLNKLGVKHGFSQRQGGVSPPPYDSLNTKVSNLVKDKVERTAANQQLIYMAMGLNHKTIIMLQLRSGGDVATITQLGGNRSLVGIDGAATKIKDTVLCFTVADCLPILLIDKQTGVIGVSHAGWQGAANKVTSKTITAMVKLGAVPSQIIAAIGPSICVNCYEVKDDVSSLFDKEFISHRGGKQYLDLWSAVESEIKDNSVSQIDNLRICTYEHADKFFSARKAAPTGRFLAVISL